MVKLLIVKPYINIKAMNREIKFRAWSNVEMTTSDKYPSMSEFWLDCCECEIMQYTGLKDKNGKEIYEGDITYHSNHNKECVIVWVQKYMTFAGKTIDDIVKDEYNYYQEIDCKNLEVIGNIYESKIIQP